MSNTQVYDQTTKLLHWLIAALIYCLVFFHPSSEEGHAQPHKWVTDIHVTLGTLLLALAVWRVIWRMEYAHVPPAPLAEKWQLKSRQLTHFILYLFMLLAPIGGLLISLTTPIEVNIFGLIEMPRLINDEAIHALMRSLHGFSADVLLYLGVLHVLAVLYHQVWLKDSLLKRMFM